MIQLQNKMLWYTISLIFLINCEHIVGLQQDYYWREYTGTIPEDAVIGGQDINGANVYIGQAYVRNRGLIVAQIDPGVKGVHVHLNANLINIDSYIKILCGHQQNFYWKLGNATHLHLLLLDKHAVIGGHVDEGGRINIGRVSHEGETKIGRILTYDVQSAWMYYSHKREIGASSYEVLMYQEVLVDERIQIT